MTHSKSLSISIFTLAAHPLQKPKSPQHRLQRKILETNQRVDTNRSDLKLLQKIGTHIE